MGSLLSVAALIGSCVTPLSPSHTHVASELVVLSWCLGVACSCMSLASDCCLVETPVLKRLAAAV